MTKQATRRRTLSVLGSLLIGLSGCGQAAGRSLTAAEIEPPVNQGSQVVIDMQIEASGKNINPDDAGFRDVTLVAYNREKRILGEQYVGAVEIGDERSVTLRCSSWPEYMTFTIADYGCQHDTIITVWKVNPPESEYPYSGLEDKRCGDPELPVPEQ
jgi:hypothetical protein